MIGVELPSALEEFPDEIQHGINALSQGISIFSKDLYLIFYNKAFQDILDLPEDLLSCRPHFTDLIRFNAERGEYGEVDIEKKVDELHHLALQFTPHKFIRKTSGGVVIEVKGVPIPSGGFVTTYTDVSELVEAREQFAKASQRFQDFTEAASDWYWETDENYCFSFFSERLEEVLGVPAKALLGQRRGKLSADGDEAKWAAHHKTICNHLPFSDFRYAIRSGDGTIKFCSVSGKPVFDEDGQFLGYRGVGKEITDQVRQEEERERAHADQVILSEVLELALLNLPLNKILKRVLDTIFKNNRRGFLEKGCVYLTQEQESKLHMVASSGLPLEKVNQYKVLDVDQCLCGDAVHKNELRFQPHQSGQEFPGERHFCIPIIKDHRLLGALVLFIADDHEQSQDEIPFLTSISNTLSGIVSRWRTQDELRILSQAVEQSPAAILITDVSGRIYYVNQALLDTSGYQREDVIGKTPNIFKSGLTPAEDYNQLWDSIISGRVWRGVLCNQTKTGEHIWEKTTIVPIKNRNGKVLSYVGVKENITESKEQEKERERLENELRQAQKMEAVGQLAGGIAHEINTPTQYVSDNLMFLQDMWGSLSQLHEAFDKLLPLVEKQSQSTQLLAEIEELKDELDFDELSDDVEEALTDAVDGTQQISRIVKAMKDFSHPGQKEMVIVDVNRALTSTATVCKNEWKYVADMEFDLEASLPQIHCLAGELNQVFLNLIVNAAHAIEERNKAEQVTKKRLICVRTRQKGECVEISVEDQGKGVPSAIHDKIFNPFFTTKIVGKGTGQGLSISHDVIVNKHRGRIWFETEEGQGSIFKVLLPIENEVPQLQEISDEE